ncbi:hypothetical protein FA95DRAFT_1571927 [Auriscalpium vulgare]|uniref:Uncharacterized protein n=1 Tax=Auriscalpium vulgare TaxID=40419 RepID=A0ACB8RWY2_9AGAM|nr:hypothetical protein FA95DRAFT_1571927 [Auriscalpium vulgare]
MAEIEATTPATLEFVENSDPAVLFKRRLREEDALHPPRPSKRIKFREVVLLQWNVLGEYQFATLNDFSVGENGMLYPVSSQQIHAEENRRPSLSEPRQPSDEWPGLHPVPSQQIKAEDDGRPSLSEPHQPSGESPTPDECYKVEFYPRHPIQQEIPSNSALTEIVRSVVQATSLQGADLSDELRHTADQLAGRLDESQALFCDLRRDFDLLRQELDDNTFRTRSLGVQALHDSIGLDRAYKCMLDKIVALENDLEGQVGRLQESTRDMDQLRLDIIQADRRCNLLEVQSAAMKMGQNVSCSDVSNVMQRMENNIDALRGGIASLELLIEEKAELVEDDRLVLADIRQDLLVAGSGWKDQEVCVFGFGGLVFFFMTMSLFATFITAWSQS